MATSTELLRAAEHMRKLSSVQRDAGLPSMADASHRAADALEREAKRLQAVECKECRGVGARPAMSAGWCECIACRGAGTQKSKRSWPEGWPPFAVLRRAYESLGVEPRPSTRWVEAHGSARELVHARDIRKKWRSCLSSDPSTP